MMMKRMVMMITIVAMISINRCSPMTGSDSHAAGGQVVSNTQGHWKPFTGTEETPNRPPTIWSCLSLNSKLSKSSVHCSAACGWLTGSKLLLGAIASKARPAPDQLSHNHNYEKSTRNHEKPAFTLSWSTRQLLWLWSYSEQPTIMMVRVMANTLLSQPHNQHLIIKVVIEVVMCLWSLS